MTKYDIGAAFKAIEDELIASMIRNMDRHRAEETTEGFQWSMWQAEQLKALEKYKRKNQKRYGKQFQSINDQIADLIRQSRQVGSMKQEIQILQAIKKGWKVHGKNKSPAHQAMTAEFFRLNDRKLEALIEATTHDMEKAETAVLQMANDQYRKAIFNAQVYANSGAGTYEKAVDMATKDMLSRGLNCIVYANGARHTLADYADMAIRTANKRAYLQGEGEKRQEWGIATVIVNKRGNPCPKCLPFCGKVLIDDVWSGGKKSDGPYPLMSMAIAAGLYHPRCKDSHTTYFPGISTADDTWTEEELAAIGQTSKREVECQYAERQIEKYGRLAKLSLDEGNEKCYAEKKRSWKEKLNSIIGHVRNDLDSRLDKFNIRVENVQDTDVKTLLKQSMDRVKFKKSWSNRSFYDNGTRSVNLSIYADDSAIAHELFHEIDARYGITDSGMISKQIKKDFDGLRKAADISGSTIEDMLYSKYPHAFKNTKWGLELKEEYRGISDIINGMSGGKINLGYYHETEYWEDSTALPSETWAQYGRMFYTQDENVLNMVKEIFPETHQEILRIIKEMIK